MKRHVSKRLVQGKDEMKKLALSACDEFNDSLSWSSRSFVSRSANTPRRDNTFATVSKLPIQHVLCHWQSVLAVGRRHELTLPARTQARFAHERTNPVAAKAQPLCPHRMHDTPAAVARAAGVERRFDVGLFLQTLRARLRAAVRLVAGAAHLQYPAGVTDRYGLPLQRAIPETQ